MTPSRERLAELNALSAQTRRERAEARKALRTGHVGLIDVLRDPPPALIDEPIMDVLRYARRTRSGKLLAAVNQQAVVDRVNLMLPLGDPRAKRAREWAMQHGVRGLHRGGPKALS